MSAYLVARAGELVVVTRSTRAGDGVAVLLGEEGGVEGDGVGWCAVGGGEGVPGLPEVLVDGPVEVGGVDELVEVGAEVWFVDEGGEEGAFGFAVGDGWSCSAGSDVVVGVERWLCLGHARLSQPVVGGVGLGAGEEAGVEGAWGAGHRSREERGPGPARVVRGVSFVPAGPRRRSASWASKGG
jgi:hypothetical protein